MKLGERMKPGDLVRVIDDHSAETFPDNDNVSSKMYVWHEFMGKFGMIVTMAKRLHIPAAKVMVLGEIAEFDLNELEKVNESG